MSAIPDLNCYYPRDNTHSDSARYLATYMSSTAPTRVLVLPKLYHALSTYKGLPDVSYDVRN